MYLLNATTHKLRYFEGKNVPKYAILSHRWEKGEVLFKEMQKGRHLRWPGWKKIQFCCQQALQDGYDYVWVDTCCIDKRSSAELSEAINSMYQWYQEAEKCYAFLSDVVVRPIPASSRPNRADPNKQKSRSSISYSNLGLDLNNDSRPSFSDSLWFSRGWTLQELLAPKDVTFYDYSWTKIGSKHRLASAIERRTKIRRHVLIDSSLVLRASIAEKISWAVGRETTRIEDRVYSLLGLLQINMPLLYGERENAFLRLIREITTSSNDFTLFAGTIMRNQDRRFVDFPILPNRIECFHNVEMYKSLQEDSLGKYQTTKDEVIITRHMFRYKLNYLVFIIGFRSLQPDQKTYLCIPVVKTGGHLRRHGLPLYRRVLIDNQALLEIKEHPSSRHSSEAFPAFEEIAEIVQLHELYPYETTTCTSIKYGDRTDGLDDSRPEDWYSCWPAVRRPPSALRTYPSTIPLEHFSTLRWRSVSAKASGCLLLAADDGDFPDDILISFGNNKFGEPTCIVEQLRGDLGAKKLQTGIAQGFFETSLGNVELLHHGKDATIDSHSNPAAYPRGNIGLQVMDLVQTTPVLVSTYSILDVLRVHIYEHHYNPRGDTDWCSATLEFIKRPKGIETLPDAWFHPNSLRYRVNTGVSESTNFAS